MANSTVLVPSGWSPRQYILAAMAGTLVACTIIIVASVILRPAKIHFCVTDARGRPAYPNGKGMVLNFTIAAVNPSRRAGVQYRDVIVNLLQQHSTMITVNATVPFYQPPLSSTSIGASGFQEWGLNSSGSARQVSVVVIAKVRFKVGVAYSRPYNVRVSCPSVDFFTDKKSSARVICKE